MRVQFGPFTVDTDTRQLVGTEGEIRLSPKAFDVLCLLLERRPKVVHKEELHARIWPGIYVVDTNLTMLVGEIRRALADSPQDARFIRTVHKVGYAFCGAAADLAGQPESSTREPTSCWVVWNDRRVKLAPGGNIIGRSPHCSVWIDASGVSRQHARIYVAGGGSEAMIEDLASTNGTFLRGSRISAAEPLQDGDAIQIGSASLTFRTWSAEHPKKTERIGRTI